MPISSAQVPVDIRDITSEDHPVKVGLSDAFVVLHEMEQIPSKGMVVVSVRPLRRPPPHSFSVPDVRRRTIYEYHKVDILKSQISSCTAVEMLPLPSKRRFVI